VQRSIKKKVVPSIDLYSKTERFCSIWGQKCRELPKVQNYARSTFKELHLNQYLLGKKFFIKNSPIPLLTRARRVQDFWTRTRFIEYFRTRDPDPDPTD
jgi:hypothetical protein